MKEIRLKGHPLSTGRAFGTVCRFNENRHDNLPVYAVDTAGAAKEEKRLAEAAERVEAQLDRLFEKTKDRIGQAEAQIFAVQKALLNDPAMKEAILTCIKDRRVNAEFAVSHVLSSYEDQFKALDNVHIRERATDIGEIKYRLLDHLRDMQQALQCDPRNCDTGDKRLIVTEELTPSMTIHLNPAHTVGFVTERGGPTSHAAIMARALGIPAVSGLPGIRERVACGTEILIDGDSGEIFIWPDKSRLTDGALRTSTLGAEPRAHEPVPGFQVMANINLPHETDESRRMHAEGVGLYRTEFELIAMERFFSEDELVDRYGRTARAMAGKPVTFRLYDIGSDKALPFMNTPKEDNPALGWRGARLLLGQEELLATQARALARVSRDHPINVLYPMIVDLAQFRLLKKVFMKSIQSLSPGIINHGIMFEVPAACFDPTAFFDHIDFASIGTNDLTQYLFAVDRDNEHVAYDYNPDRPVFWALIKGIADAAKAAGKPLSICGELAGDPALIPKLLELGIDKVSVSPKRIPAVRRAAAHRLDRLPIK